MLFNTSSTGILIKRDTTSNEAKHIQNKKQYHLNAQINYTMLFLQYYYSMYYTYVLISQNIVMQY